MLNTKKFSRYSSLLLLVILSLLIYSCSESEEMIQKKLKVICEDDLKAIIEGLPEEKLLEKPYYKITSYKKYEKGKYSRKAEVEYYFFKNLGVKVFRQYRYHTSVGMWERYTNKYVFIHDTTKTTMDKK
ncbi:MAG: hypothetical protein N2053_01665 [Chitinispirillaceae bacterium]|nr:hypothetical protein [Chitinispirillaceae bacterium]